MDSKLRQIAVANAQGTLSGNPPGYDPAGGTPTGLKNGQSPGGTPAPMQHYTKATPSHDGHGQSTPFAVKGEGGAQGGGRPGDGQQNPFGGSK